MMESIEMKETSTDEEKKQLDEDVEKRRQYLQVDLESQLVDAGCCPEIQKLTAYIASASGDTSLSSVKPTIDDVDKSAAAVEAFFQVAACDLHRDAMMKTSLKRLRKSIVPMVVEEEEEEGDEGDRTIRDLAGRIEGVIALVGDEKSEL